MNKRHRTKNHTKRVLSKNRRTKRRRRGGGMVNYKPMIVDNIVKNVLNGPSHSMVGTPKVYV